MEKQKKDLIPLLLLRLFIGILFLTALYLVLEFVPHNQIAYYVLFTLISSLFLDVFNNKVKIYPSFLKHIHEDSIRLSAHSLFLLGVFLSLAYLDTGLVFIAAAMTIVATIGGDAFRHYRVKHFPFSGSTQGFIMAFFLSACAGFSFLPSYIIVIPMALTAAFIESFASYKEDHLLVPICATLVGQIILNLL